MDVLHIRLNVSMSRQYYYGVYSLDIFRMNLPIASLISPREIRAIKWLLTETPHWIHSICACSHLFAVLHF